VAYPIGNPFRHRLHSNEGHVQKTPHGTNVDIRSPPLSMNAIMPVEVRGSPLFTKELNGLFEVRSLLPFTCEPYCALGSSSSPERRDSRGVDSVCLGPWQVRLTCFSLMFCHHSLPYFTEEPGFVEISCLWPCTAVKRRRPVYPT